MSASDAMRAIKRKDLGKCTLIQVREKKVVFWKTVHVNITLSLSQKTRGELQSSHRITVQAPAHSYSIKRRRRGNNQNHINNNKTNKVYHQNDKFKQAKLKPLGFFFKHCCTHRKEQFKTSFITLCTAIQYIHLTTLAIHKLPGLF